MNIFSLFYSSCPSLASTIVVVNLGFFIFSFVSTKNRLPKYKYVAPHFVLFRAASCKSQQGKNNSTRKNNSIGKHIFRYKMCFLIELFFLVELSFSFWLLHEVSLRYCKWRAYHFYQRKSHYDLSTCPKRTRYRFFKKSMSFLKKI